MPPSKVEHRGHVETEGDGVGATCHGIIRVEATRAARGADLVAAEVAVAAVAVAAMAAARGVPAAAVRSRIWTRSSDRGARR